MPSPHPLHLRVGVVALLLALGCASAGSTPGGQPASALSVARDLPYAYRDGGWLRADVYRARPGRLPAVVVIHPGGWFSGGKGDVARTARRLAEAGYVAVAPEYRLAPQHRFPAQIHDVKEAVRWARADAARLGIDPGRIAALGYSAGGHLAALLATSGPADGLEGPTAYPDVSSRVQALVAGGAPVDLAAMRPNPAVSSLLGGSAAARPELAASASPVSFVSPDDPPTFLYHGALDLLVARSQPRRFLEALGAAGVGARLELSRLGHFTTWLFGGSQETQAIAFLDRALGARGGPLLAREARGTEPSS